MDKKDDDDSDDDLGCVPSAAPMRAPMLSFETLSMASGSSSGSSSGTLSSCSSLSGRDSELSRLASQLKGLRISKEAAPSATTTASFQDYASRLKGLKPSKPSVQLPGNKPEKILPSAASQLQYACYTHEFSSIARYAESDQVHLRFSLTLLHCCLKLPKASP